MTRTPNHLVRKQALNHLTEYSFTNWMAVGSRCCHLKLSSLFQAYYDFRRLRRWFKLDEIFNVNIKETDSLCSWIHWLIM